MCGIFAYLNHLTPKTRREILDLLIDLQEESGMGLIMITHDMGVVAETADRVIVQYQGVKREEADVLSLRKEHGIYMPTSGRINIAGLKSEDIPRVAHVLKPLLG